MTLDRWLRRKKMSEEAFAGLVDDTCTQSLVSKWRRGVVLPSWKRRIRIEELTDAAVTAAGLRHRYKRTKAASKARGEEFRRARGIE